MPLDRLNTTFVLSATLGVCLLMSQFLWAWLLWIGARWAKVGDVSYKRALLVTILLGAAGLCLRVLVMTLQGKTRYPYVVPILEFVAVLVVTWSILKWFLQTSWTKAILAWLPTLVGTVAVSGFVIVLFRPYLFEAFVTSTNAMAPTILGRHVRSTCRTCGGTGYFSPISEYSASEELGICERCLGASDMAVSNRRAYAGDKILAAKYLRPQRWDLIVFRYPEDPSIVFVKRLVGLPGEEISIQDGDIFINGTLAPKPAAISGIVYVADPLDEKNKAWGPVRLREDEYFVLGDFSLRSKDSRLWQMGAPGHASYAVPTPYLIGVVTHTYWPPARWRVFR